MRTRIILFVTTILLINCFVAAGQANKFTPVTPEAAALAKMVNYPMNYNTGVPDIQIPLYEINVGSLKLPVDLVYHAGGFRINEQATRAGLGWSISSNLQITRTVNGKDDFLSSGYINNNLVKAYYPNASSCPGCEYPTSYLENYFLATGAKDASPDKFSYKLLNKTGSFYFQKNDYGTGYSIVPVPFDNIGIEYNSGQFIITDVDGTKYFFGEPGSGDINQILGKGIEVSESISGSVRSAWKCKRILSAQGVQEISFTYEPKTMTTYRSYNDDVEYYNNAHPCWTQFYKANEYPMNGTTDYDDIPVPFYQIASPKYMMNYGNGYKSYFHAPYLDGSDNVVDAVYERINLMYGSWQNVYGLSVSEINFRGGKVKFNGADELNYIQVLGPSGEELKTVSFFHSYATPGYSTEAKLYNGQNFQGTLYMDSLHIKNGTNTYERYALSYESKFCFGNHLKGQDAWGYPNQSTMEIAYANNTGANLMSLPTIKVNQDRFYRNAQGGCTDFATDIPVTVTGNNGAEISSEDAMKKGMLKRIVYPTGGYVDFDFEANRYNEVFSWDDESETLPQLAGGLRIRSINTYDGTGRHTGQKYYRYGIFEEGAGLLINKPPRSYENGGFHYGSVGFNQEIAYLEAHSLYGATCYSKDCLSVLAVEKKTTYQPASALDYTYGTGAPVYYEKVTEYNQDLGKKTGKTVYEYYAPDEFFDGFYARLNLDSRISGTNINRLKTDGLLGMQKSVKKYRFNTNAKSYELNKMYQLIYKKDFTYTRYLKPQQVRVNYAFMRTMYNIVSGNWGGNQSDLYNTSQSFMASPYYPSSNFIYGRYGIPVGRLLPDEVSETSYTGTSILNTLTQYEYAYLPYLNPSKVTTFDSKGAKTEKQVKYAYNFGGTAIYDSMVNRNMVSMPVEEIETNVTLGNKEVARHKTEFSNFPAGLGVIAPASISNSVNGQPLQAVTHFQEYDQYGNVLQLTGRDGVPVSYLWGYQYLYPVAELKGQTYAAIPASYKGNTQITNPVNDAGLRTLLLGLNQPNVMLDIYTYRPLVGVSSHTGPRNKITYFEYDPIGRLVSKKDQDGHILNQFSYKMLNYSSTPATWKSYANVPVMFSHNAAGTGFWYFYNNIIEGGKYSLGSNQVTPDIHAQQEAETDTTTVVPDAPPADNSANVYLVYFDDDLDGIYPLYYVDFIQNDAVVATFKCKSFFWSDPEEQIAYIPAGTYKVSIRVGADQRYDNGFLMFSVSDPANPAAYQNFKNGDTVIFTAGHSYGVIADSRVIY